MDSPAQPCLLVIDDEPEVCASVHHLLRRKFKVLQAQNADEAVEIMAQNEVHIIMTDQRMPHVTGVEILQKAKSHYPEAIRMLFTGFTDLHSVIAAINQGHVYRYLSKPWQPEELEAAVADALAEYNRLVQRARQLQECMGKLATLEQRFGDLAHRMTELEAENRNLRTLFDDLK